MAYAEERILFLGNKMQDVTSKERTRLNPGQERIHFDPISGRRLNPISGEDSRHTSILCQERTVNTPQSWFRREQ
jgi:hypothetical protein